MVGGFMPRTLVKVLTLSLACIGAVLAGRHLAVKTDRDPSEGDATYGKAQTFDFGEGQVGQVIRHVFRISNPTDRTMHVSRVIASCSCTVLKRDLTIINPHSAVDLPVEVKL